MNHQNPNGQRPRTNPVVRAFTFACVFVGCGVSAAERAPRTSGADLYDTCAPCHGDKAQGTVTVEAPPLAGLPSWYVTKQLQKFADGRRGAHPDHPAGLRMRPIAISLEGDIERQAVAEFVSSLTPAPVPSSEIGDAKLGAQLFAACAACHGQDRSGNEAMGAPGLVGMAPWAIRSALDAFAAGHRGGPTDGPKAQGMKAMSGIASTETNRAAIIAYLTSLQSNTKE